MLDGATRWLTYDDMAEALHITPDSARRLATRHKWPRRPGNDGRALVAVPEERLERPHEPRAEGADDEADVPPEAGRDARALIGYLERRIGELTDDLAESRRVAEEARNEAREARAAAEALRVQAGQADVLTALVAAERAHLCEVRVERDRLVALLTERPTPWIERISGLLRKAA
jgi:hypothetical protein